MDSSNPFTNNSFAALFEDDEEAEAIRRSSKVKSYNSTSVEKRLESSFRAMKKKFPMGGLKMSRFITTDILIDSGDYFDQFNDDVKQGVDFVQTALMSSGSTEVIADAQNNPTDDDKQELAYRAVQGATGDWMANNPKFRGVERAVVAVLIANEIIGFSVIDPLWRDSRVDEILCNGPKDVQVEIAGKLIKVPGCSFRDRDHMSNLIERLYGAIGKVVSKTTPIVDGRLHDNSRMAVVHQSVAPDGPNFSIRRHKEDYIGPEQLIKWGTASQDMLEYLGNLIYKGCSVLVIGGTSSGKTVTLGALTSFLRPDHRILTLEDNLEMKLAPTKLCAAPMECLPPHADQPGSGVSMRDLVKASLRLRPNAIIVGEVRDGAAWDLCQALNTGHYGMSTIHANSNYDAIYRLVSLVTQGGMAAGDQVLPLIAASFDVIVQVERFPTDGSRKIVSISEVAPFPERKDSGDLYLPTNTLWQFVDEGIDDDLHVLGHFEQVGDMGETRRKLRRLDLERNMTWDELCSL